jgi:hypothetical protein
LLQREMERQKELERIAKEKEEQKRWFFSLSFLDFVWIVFLVYMCGYFSFLLLFSLSFLWFEICLF